jgi:hypothetical protein
MDLVPDEEGGNLFLVNGSMTPLKNAGAAYQQSAQSGGTDPPEQEETEQEPEKDTENAKPHRRGRRNK